MKLEAFDLIQKEDSMYIVLPESFPLPTNPLYIMFDEFYFGLESSVLLGIDYAGYIGETPVLGFSKDSMEYETLEETANKTIEELRSLYETLLF